MPNNDGAMLVANDTFTTRFDGSDHQFTKGETRVRVGHPILRGLEHLFEPVEAHYEWEQATQAPGEQRERTGLQPARTPVTKPLEKGK